MKDTGDPHRYDDIINLPHHRSAVHPPMSMQNRAAQFAPFAALTGYEELMEETARLTDEKPELSEARADELNSRLGRLSAALRAGEHPVLQITRFVPDLLKDGGAYETVIGAVKRIDMAKRRLILFADNQISNGLTIELDRITAVGFPENE